MLSFKSLTSNLNSNLILLFLLLFLSYVCLLTFFSSSELPTKVKHENLMPYLADKPISEDGFYMLTVAWNFGQGKGFEYNQGLKTSGVQPLATVVYGILAFISNQLGIDKKDFPRVIILFSGLTLLLFSIVLKNTILKLFSGFDKEIVFILCLLLGMLNFDLFVSFTNGLETGIYITMVLLSINMYWKILNMQNFKGDISAGIIFGLTALARLDFIIVSVCLLMLAVFFSKIKLKTAFTIQLLQLIIILPWLYYTYELTGSIIQSSASSQMGNLTFSNALHETYLALLAFLQVVTLNIYTGNKNLVLVGLGLVFLTTIIFFLYKKRKVFNGVKFLCVSIFTAFVILMIAYTILSRATHFYFRYFSPMIILILLVIIPLLYARFKSFSIGKSLVISVFFISVFFSQAYLYLHSGKLGVHFSIRPEHIKRNFSDRELIGVFNSGVTGYYCSNVINLDGKINHTALQYSRAGRLSDFMDLIGLSGLIEIKEFFPIGDSNKFYSQWQTISSDIGDGRTICYKRLAP